MKARFAGAMVAALALPLAASADGLTVNDMIRKSYSDTFTLGMMTGMYIGGNWSNAFLMKSRNETPFFCPPGPQGIDMTPEQVRSIVEAFIRKNPEKGQMPSTFVGGVLFNAMISAFPCK
ncbi:Rap1a/Tai family immunity protein [Rhizobium sp. RAF56]|jgi:hypothetical protein|uniref:Rap1a/Tai family immunity protein n=1 Tax=Rhizobium sp. RAF56 TaxID=3233062 RepID=UPI003F94C03A